MRTEKEIKEALEKIIKNKYISTEHNVVISVREGLEGIEHILRWVLGEVNYFDKVGK